MQGPPQTPKQVAETLYGLMPHAFSPQVLEEYGIEATSEQAEAITREILSLNLFWIDSALEAHLTALGRERVRQELDHIIEAAWGTEFNLERDDREAFSDELQTRQRLYAATIQKAESPISVFTETAAILESSRVLKSEDRTKLLALLIDLVPVEAYGELVADIELREGG